MVVRRAGGGRVGPALAAPGSSRRPRGRIPELSKSKPGARVESTCEARAGTAPGPGRAARAPPLLMNWTLLLLGLAATSVAMAACWLLQRRGRVPVGAVDVVWTLAVPALVGALALAGGGWWPRRALLAALVGLWGARLARHLVARLAREGEDSRYRRLRDQLGAGYQRWLLVFFLAQALIATVLAGSLVPLVEAPVEGWRLADALGLAVWLGAVVGEGVADRQLARWKADPDRSGRTCRAGLWRYSRHPNYFFEWLHWVGYACMALGLAWGWVAWLAPLLMLVLVLRVTGIPPTEAQALARRGEDYRAYQRTTNAFFPGPVRSDPALRSSPR